MFPAVETRNLPAVRSEVEAVFSGIFPAQDPGFITRCFAWAEQCFSGRYPGYQAIDARYHDLEHTLQGTLALACLWRGAHRAGARPALTPRMFELGLLAILLHDTGYLKRAGDTAGTGAKYTLTHVRRSGEFAAVVLAEQGYPAPDILAVQNMIRCTGVNADLSVIPFGSELERLTGYALGTADLLGQMAAPDYVDKLPILYAEFAEALAFQEAGPVESIRFASAEDMMRRTPEFWEHYVRPKIERDFRGVFRYLADPFPDGPNPYLEAVETNIARLRGRWTGAAAD